MRRLRSSRGFTLMEVVVAIVMLTFGVLASAGLTAALMRSNRGVTNRTRAIETLRIIEENLQSTSYGQIANGSRSTVVGGTSLNSVWTVTANSPAANLKTITMTVTWSDRQGSHTITNTTIRAQ